MNSKIKLKSIELVMAVEIVRMWLLRISLWISLASKTILSSCTGATIVAVTQYILVEMTLQKCLAFLFCFLPYSSSKG